MTKYADLGNLVEFLESRKGRVLSEDETRSIVGQIALGLADLHQNDFIHRDISHENILLFSKKSAGRLPSAKLSDFSQAR